MEKIHVNTIEDCLEIISGYAHALFVDILEKDKSIIHSISKQVVNNKALTDKQFALMQEKLAYYKPQLESLGVVNFDAALKQLRIPLREIDRSMYIKLCTKADNVSIELRFPFSKKIIAVVSRILKGVEYFYKKEAQKYHIEYSDLILYNLVSALSEFEFEVSQEVCDVYNKIVDIKNNKQQYVCGIYGDKLLNMHSCAQKIAEQEVGTFSKETALKYIDRKRRYGIYEIPRANQQTVAQKIAYRSTPDYQSKPSEESTNSILSALWELDRFPLLVILNKQHAETELYELQEYFRYILPTEQQSVLFRLDSGSGFNALIKDRKLNNWVDNSTKIVYISKDNLPKLLLKTDWQPLASLSYESNLNAAVNAYVNRYCDLIVFREEVLSPFRNHIVRRR